MVPTVLSDQGFPPRGVPSDPVLQESCSEQPWVVVRAESSRGLLTRSLVTSVSCFRS